MADEHILVMSDGGLASLIACAVAKDSGPRRTAVVLPILWEPVDAGPHMTAAARQAELCGLRLLEAADGVALGHTPALVHSAMLAAAAGIPTVIWPVHVGQGAEPDLDRVAVAVDRALLVSRLVALDAPEHGCPAIRVDASYADFTDRQLAELALDLDAPIHACWWWDGQGGTAAAERQRWTALLESCGWSPV
jgi:hypothetical protein